MKRKMAIVSSYSESCGNAAFTKVIHDSVEHFHPNVDVEVIELDLVLLQSTQALARTKANKHIKELALRLKDYDLVNLQLESGLYGSYPNDVVKRFNLLLKANPKTTVTFHSPRIITNSASDRSYLKLLFMLKIKSAFKELASKFYSTVHIKINKKLLKKAIKSNAKIIVHTGRAKKQIEIFFNYKNVAVHPLKLIPSSFIANKKTFQVIKNQAKLAKGDISIGLFGYISSYKGHQEAFEALKLLPKNYKLFIFGRQHPQTLKANGTVDFYISKLVKQVITEPQLKSRILFLGELNDSDFLSVASSVDVAWLPYYENGQDGSGIASICLDMCPRVLCSSSFAFDELFKQIKYKNVQRFDIGNFSEMALKTQMIMNTFKVEKPYGNEDKFNIETQARLYVESL